MRAKNIAYIILLIIAFLLAMSVFSPSWAQQTQTAGNATSNYKILGRLMADSVVKVPTLFKIYHYPGWDSTGSLAVVGGIFYYHNGLIWKTPGSSPFDSTFIYAALADTAAVLRALIRADTGYVPYIGATRNFTTNFGVSSYADTVYNRTPTTGNTILVVKEGAGQTTNAISVKNNSNTEIAGIKSGNIDFFTASTGFSGGFNFGLNSGVYPVFSAGLNSNNGIYYSLFSALWQQGINVVLGWTNGAANGTITTGISQISSLLLGFGNGTLGDFSGSARMNRLIANSIAMPGSTSGTLTATPAAITTSYTWVYPNGAGTSGQVLTTNGTGVTSWFTPSFGLGTVTSVGLVAGPGTGVAGVSPITTSGTFTVTNTAPDQTVVLNNGTGILVTGTYPIFTITATNSGAVTSVVGTANKITIAGTTVPTVSIAPTYAGQTSIITLGGVTTGTWSATPVDTNHGGTSAITARTALNNLLPPQSGNGGKVLQTDAANASWVSGSSFLASAGSTITITAGSPTNIDLNLSKLNTWLAQIKWGSALGTITHLLGPPDQTFNIRGVDNSGFSGTSILLKSGNTSSFSPATPTGDITMEGGDNSTNTGGALAGSVLINGGTGSSSGGGGNIVLTAKGGAGAGGLFPAGFILLTTENKTNANTGTITIQPGKPTTSTAVVRQGGSTSLSGGNGSDGNIGTGNVSGGGGGQLALSGGTGGATTSIGTSTVTVTGGAGAGAALSSGAGGAASLSSGLKNGNGGAGGLVSIVGSPGGVTVATVTGTGGAGGGVLIQTGVGGAATSGAGVRNGGDAGKVIFNISGSSFGATARGALGTYVIKIGGAVIDSVDSTQQYSSVGLRTGNAFSATGNTTTTIYAGQTLMTIIIFPAGTETIKVGTTSGAADVVPSTSFTAGTLYTITPLISTFSTTANQTLFIQGASGSVFYNLKTL